LRIFLQRFQVFSGVFVSFLDACFKCFIYHLQTYVASVVYECFQNRSGVVSLSSPSAASLRCLLLLSTLARHPPPTFLDAGDVRSDVEPTWAYETRT